MFDCKDEEALLKRIEEPYSPRIVSTTTYYGETEGLIIRYGMTTKKEIEEVLKDQLPDADCNLKYTDFTLYPNFSLKPLYDITSVRLTNRIKSTG